MIAEGKLATEPFIIFANPVVYEEVNAVLGAKDLKPLRHQQNAFNPSEVGLEFHCLEVAGKARTVLLGNGYSVTPPRPSDGK